MKTKVVELTRDLIHNRTQASKVIQSIAGELERGGLVIYPTETTYALGADATNEDAVKKIYEIKQRPVDKDIPIIVSDKYMIAEYAELNPLALHLMETIMPGPLTLIVPKKPGCALAPSLSDAGVAFRIPGNDFARAIASDLGKPVTSTSANISGSEPLYHSDQVRQLFDGKVSLILDAGQLPTRPPSTILDLLGNEPKIVREGPLAGKELLREIREFMEKPAPVPVPFLV